MSTCIDIPDSLYYVILAGAGVSMLGALVSIVNMICPFVSNVWQDRIHNRNHGLLQYIADRVTIVNQTNGSSNV